MSAKAWSRICPARGSASSSSYLSMRICDRNCRSRYSWAQAGVNGADASPVNPMGDGIDTAQLAHADPATGRGEFSRR